MKPVLILLILAASLGGCVVAPPGYDGNRGGYYQDRGYNQERGYYHNDNEGNYRGYYSRDHD
jgi:hypothetical protein